MTVARWIPAGEHVEAETVPYFTLGGGLEWADRDGPWATARTAWCTQTANQAVGTGAAIINGHFRFQVAWRWFLSWGFGFHDERNIASSLVRAVQSARIAFGAR